MPLRANAIKDIHRAAKARNGRSSELPTCRLFVQTGCPPGGIALWTCRLIAIAKERAGGDRVVSYRTLVCTSVSTHRPYR